MKAARIFCRGCGKTTDARKVEIKGRGGATWGSECADCGLVHPTLAPGLAYRRGRQRAISRATQALESAGQLNLFNKGKSNG